MAKVLVLSERFWPEEFLVNDVVRELRSRGDAVEVLTQVPSYPFDKIYDGYENKRLQTTYWDGVPVHRVNTWFGYNKSAKRKILNYLHFGWRTFWWAFRHGRAYDRVVVVHTAALTMASAVYALKKRWRKPITIWTQDLWPDAVWGYGIRKTRFREFVLNAFVKSIYACCDRVAVSCPSYVGRLKEITGRDAEFIPQWEPTMIAGRAPHQKGDGEKRVFMFAGNLGVPQNLDNDIEGFLKAGVANAELWILGGGVRFEELKARYGSSPGVKFMGRQPKDSMPEWFAKADVLIISLTRAYSGTLPGKFQSYCAAAKPILGIIEGSAADLIRDNGLGVVSAPDDVNAIADGYRQMMSADLVSMGARSRSLSETMFNREQCLRDLLRV